mmetsp:Transcript_106554/g.189451  ORF Transcript_106554/g.189451 Transcript_106554/m.189451 type:complete len:689 (-) Transcript_106554:158-2224(-)
MALEAAAVSGSAALGCSTIGIALYANAVAWRSGVSEDASQETPGLASSILTTSCRQVMKVLEAPSLVSAALSDPADDLRLAASQGEILATAAECSVNGKPPTSGFVTFNGEVLKVGTNLASAIPIIALGGAEVSLQGKDITIVPKESPALVVQLDTFSQATEWEATLKTCARKLSHPAKRLEEVLHQASDFQKAIDDLNIQVQRVSPRHHAHHHAEHGTGHGHHGHGQEHGQHSECDGHAHHDGDGHGHHDGHQKGGESNQKTIFMAAEAYSKIEELKNSLLMAESRLTQQDEELLQLQARNAALKHDNGHLQDDLLFFKSSQGSVGSDLQSRAVRQDQIISDQEIQIAELQNDLHQQKLQHDREMEAALADNLALQKEVNELYVQLDGELSKETLAPDEPQLQQAQAEMGSLQTVLSAANQELEQMRARFNAAEKELAIQTENQAKSSLALVEKHQEELDFLNAELAKAKVQADTYKEQAEQANQANRELNVKLQEEKLAVKETPDVASPLDDTDGNALRGDKKLTARELQAIQTHLQSVHKRAGAAEARSRTLEKDKASNEALKQMLSEQKEHYENALQALSQKLEEQSIPETLQPEVTKASEMENKSDSSVSTNNPRDPRYVRDGNIAGSRRRPRSAGKFKPSLPEMAFVGWAPDTLLGGKNRPLSGRVPALDAMAERRVTVTAA